MKYDWDFLIVWRITWDHLDLGRLRLRCCHPSSVVCKWPEELGQGLQLHDGPPIARSSQQPGV